MKLPFWATAFTVCGVITLCALGTWQIKRLTWKNDIIAKLNAAYTTSTNTLNFNSMHDNDFAYGSITGQFLFDRAILMGHRVQNEKAGQSLLVPLKTNQGTLLVNMGFNPAQWTLKNHPLKFHNNQAITLTGLARKPSWNHFTPHNDPQDNIWYRADIDQIATAKGLEIPIPYIFYADKSSENLGDAFPNNTRWQPNNNHGQYAFFWFTLASALIIIYTLRFIKK